MKRHNEIKVTWAGFAISCLLICLFAGWILYSVIGHQFIESIYNGQSIRVLNELIKGQDTHPLEYYFKSADYRFLMFNFCLINLILFLAVSWLDIVKSRISVHTRRVVIFSAIYTIIIGIFFGLLGWNGTIWHTMSFLHFDSVGQDSWSHMSKALDYLSNGNRDHLYEQVFLNRGAKFQYPPSSLIFLQFLQSISPSWRSIWTALCWISIAVTAIFSIKAFSHGICGNVTGYRQDRYSHTDLAFLWPALMFFSLTFYPLVKGYTLGQIQVWIDAVFAIGFVCWISGKHFVSGMMTAIACVIKPQMLIMVVWAMLQKQKRFLLGFAAVFVPVLLVALVVFGISAHVDYIRVLSYISRHGDSYYANQSVNGLINRLFLNGRIMDWRGLPFSPFNPVSYGATMLTSTILIGLALFWTRRTRSHASVMGYAIISITSVIASPIAWEHHYGILLPIFAFLFGLYIRKGRPIRYLLAAYLLTATFLLPVHAIANIPGINLLLSYRFAGGLLLLAFLYFLDRKENVICSEPNPDIA